MNWPRLTGADHELPLKVTTKSPPTAAQKFDVGHDTDINPPESIVVGDDHAMPL
jgi:hypothetical protein